MYKPLSLGLFLLCLALVVGCQTSETEAGGMQVLDAWARPTMRGSDQQAGDSAGAGEYGPSAIYLRLKNTGSEPERLIRATTDVARSVEIHESREEAGVMRMSRVEGIDIPGRGEVHLQPGGYHIMLEGVNRPLAPSDTFSITLIFERAGSLSARVEVREP